MNSIRGFYSTNYILFKISNTKWFYRLIYRQEELNLIWFYNTINVLILVELLKIIQRYIVQGEN